MKYRKLGRSAIEISEVGFGCMSLHANNSENVQLLQQAFDGGINYFDTADLYDRGENERLVGRALRSVRHQVVIGTKVGNQWRKDGTGWDWNPSPGHILKAIDESLQRLQTDYVDLYLLHGGTIDDPIDDIIAAFESMRSAGKIRMYGISSIRPNVVRQYVEKSKLSATMMQYNLLDRRPEEASLALLAEQEVSVLARGVLAKGLLAGKSPEHYLSLGADEVGNFLRSLDQQRMAAHAIGYVLWHRAVTSAVIGMRTKQQLNDIIRYHRKGIAPIDYQRLHAKAPELRYKEHR